MAEPYEYESLEGLEDRVYDFSVEDVEADTVADAEIPCGGCTPCAVGSTAVGGSLDNDEAVLDIVEVEFKANRTGFYLNESGVLISTGAYVIVEAERGIDLGRVSFTGEIVHQKRRARGLVGHPMRKIIRMASDEEIARYLENRKIEEKAVHVFKEKAVRYGLTLKLVTVEYQFDGSRITFFFSCDGRVDFRALVRDLASVYKTRIELRQIGARDEARKIGGYGTCGRELCCLRWLDQLKHVTLEHAKAQNISLNPGRLAGLCGRLKCCLLYEYPANGESQEYFPAINSKVITIKGEGVVERVDVFNDLVYLRYEKGRDVERMTLAEFKSCQIQNH
ncbi:MAG: PSP1 domain-containing protein [Candidatus Kryptoniota bacterium]